MADLIDREEIDAVIACLGDDAAQLRDDNPDDERADNMDRAARLLQRIADANSAVASLLLRQDREGAVAWAKGLHLNMDHSGGLTAAAEGAHPVAWRDAHDHALLYREHPGEGYQVEPLYLTYGVDSHGEVNP